MASDDLDDLSTDGEVRITVAVGVMGVLASIYDPWVGDTSVNVYVSVARALTVILLFLPCVIVLGVVIDRESVDQYPFLIATITLAIGASVSTFCRAVAVVLTVATDPVGTIRQCDNNQNDTMWTGHAHHHGKSRCSLHVTAFSIIMTNAIFGYVKYWWKHFKRGFELSARKFCGEDDHGHRGSCRPRFIFILVLDAFVLVGFMLPVLIAAVIEGLISFLGASLVTHFLCAATYHQQCTDGRGVITKPIEEAMQCDHCARGYGHVCEKRLEEIGMALQSR